MISALEFLSPARTNLSPVSAVLLVLACPKKNRLRADGLSPHVCLYQNQNQLSHWLTHG